MREIKFRAWDKLDKQMREVSAINFFDEMVTLDEQPNGDYFKRHQTLVEIMQYTGLKDKKGKEIYEGDIVKEEAWGFERSNAEGRTGAITIEPSRGVVLGGRSPLWANNCEVIGNIYENPELLSTLNK